MEGKLPLDDELVAISKLPLTQDTLKQLLYYCPETGLFTWLGRTSYRNYKGKVVCTKAKQGYILIGINSTRYNAHRLAFLYMLGKFPDNQVDHINGIRNDNSWINLREVTGQQNSANSKIRKDNTSGVKGISWYKRRDCWEASINLDGKKHRVGYFKELKDAEIALRRFRELLHKEHTNHGD